VCQLRVTPLPHSRGEAVRSMGIPPPPCSHALSGWWVGAGGQQCALSGERRVPSSEYTSDRTGRAL
jgi:hypothetical protein